MGEELDHGCDEEAGDGDQRAALAKQAAQLRLVARPVLKRYHLRDSHIVSDEYRTEYEPDVHQYAIGGDAVLAYVFHQLEIVANADDVEGDVADEFGQAVRQ